MEIKNSLKKIYKWVIPVIDPIYVVEGLQGLIWYFRDWQRYKHMPLAENFQWKNAYPQLHDKTKTTGIDPHYFYTNGWAMRKIISQSPSYHVDIGSQTMFVNLLSAVIPVAFLDFRPMLAHISGLSSVAADIIHLPFESNSVWSLSCLHVVEHIGLGRYGDPLNPLGSKQACAELMRVLAPGGNLFFVLPVGKPRICFNAHRVHASETISEYFSGLELMELSGVKDDGTFIEHIDPDVLKSSDYACGMFWFRKN